MVREKEIESDITTLRSEIAGLVRSIGRIESEMSATRAATGKASPAAHKSAAANNGTGAASNGHDEAHHLTDELLSGAMKLGHEASGAAAGAMHASASWIDDLLRKNPTPAVLAALGVGFVLGAMTRK